MNNKTSILTDQLNAIYTAKDVDEAKQLFVTLVEGSKLPKKTKALMLFNISQCGTLYQVQKYATNSCFKYNGLGVM
jgi:hypothetical protein